MAGGWGLNLLRSKPPHNGVCRQTNLPKQLKDGTEAAKEAIEQVTETLPRIQKVKHELANEWVADCITLLEQHSLLDRLMEWAPGLPEGLRSAHLPESGEALTREGLSPNLLPDSR